MKEKVIVFGAGTYGSHTIERYREEKEILFCIDNNKLKIGQVLKGLTVLSPSALLNSEFDKVLIASVYRDEIYDQLVNSLNIHPNKIETVGLDSVIPRANVQRACAFSKLDYLIKIFKDIDLNYWVDHSSLLGLIRDGDLFASSDIDLCIMEQDLPRLRLLLSDHFLDGFSTQQIIKYSPYERSQCRTAEDVKEIKKIYDFIDIHVKYTRDEQTFWQVGPMLLAVPEHFHKSYEIRNWHDLSVRVPKNPEAYLAALYGEWRHPKTNWTYADYNNITNIFSAET